MIRIGRRKKSDSLQLEALGLHDVVLSPPAHDSLAGSQRRRRRRRGSTGMIAEVDAAEIPSAPRRPFLADSELPARRRSEVPREKSAPRRCRIDKSHLQVHRIGLASTAKASSTKANDQPQDSPCLTADLTPNNQAEEETLDMYFDVMKRRSDFRRKLLDLNDPDLFDTTDQCAQTVFAPAESVASGAMTILTEPAVRPCRSGRKKNGKKESTWRVDESFKLPRRVYAQIEFDQGRSDVKFWKLRSSGNDEKTEQAGDENCCDNIQPHAKYIPSDKKRDFEQEDSSNMETPTLEKSKLSFRRFSSSAA